MVSRRGSHFVANWCIVDFVFGLVVVTGWKNQDQRYIVKICCRAPCGRVGRNMRKAGRVISDGVAPRVGALV